MKARAWLGALAALLIAAGAGAYFFRGEIATRIFERSVRQAVGENLRAELPDGLHAIFCGTGSPLPDRTRAGPCLAVLAGQHLFVFDAGDGSSETLQLMGVRESESATRVSAMLAAVGLSGRDAAMPAELSGGELQRVAIARALVHRPRLLLADEPTGNLDPDTAEHVLKLLREQIKERNAAGILVTHSRHAADTADRVLQLTPAGLRDA